MTMRHVISAVIVAVLLVGCSGPTREQRHAELIELCQQFEFTVRQCQVIMIFHMTDSNVSAIKRMRKLLEDER